MNINKTLFIVTAFRKTENHSYVVGVFDDFEKAKNIAVKEETYRDRKYVCEVLPTFLNSSINDCFYPKDTVTIEPQVTISEESIPVMLHLNDEAGQFYWSVESKNEPGFWLDSFDTIEEAHQYITDNKCLYNPEKDFYCSLSEGRKYEYLLQATDQEYKCILRGRRTCPAKSR